MVTHFKQAPERGHQKMNDIQNYYNLQIKYVLNRMVDGGLYRDILQDVPAAICSAIAAFVDSKCLHLPAWRCTLGQQCALVYSLHTVCILESSMHRPSTILCTLNFTIFTVCTSCAR